MLEFTRYEDQGHMQYYINNIYSKTRDHTISVHGKCLGMSKKEGKMYKDNLSKISEGQMQDYRCKKKEQMVDSCSSAVKNEKRQRLSHRPVIKNTQTSY